MIIDQYNYTIPDNWFNTKTREEIVNFVNNDQSNFKLNIYSICPLMDGHLLQGKGSGDDYWREIHGT